MNQRGIVSLISVSVIAIFILVITVATSSLMVGELTQSVDNSVAVTAHYAAYSGLEETYALVSAANRTLTPLASLQHDCGPGQNASIQPFLPDISNVRAPVGHTCRIIQAVTTDPHRTLKTDTVDQYNLTFDQSNPLVLNKYIGTIDFSWSDLDGTAFPPPVIFTIDSFPKDKGAVGNKPTDIRSVILQSSGSAPTPADFNSITGGAIVTGTNCTGGTCSISLTNLLNGVAGGVGVPNDYQTVLRLRPYSTTSSGIQYSMRVYDQNHVALKVVAPSIHADMTSRSGDTYARLSNDIPIQSRSFSILDNVIFGNNSICKDFQVFTDNAGYQKIQTNPTGVGCEIPNLTQE